MEQTTQKDKKRYVPTDCSGLIRDTRTNAVLSSDLQALHAHRERINSLKKNQVRPNDINKIKDEVDIIKNEMSEIKNLLKDLISSRSE